ncbi:MAG TPA: MEKHLA domain-containing protein [Gammaproteobacteria bacterium]|nr:MEKHLA domain-containing protein [Gammaproteobacteria bacterium]
MSRPEPGPENAFLCEHAELLISSYQRITGRELIEQKCSREENAQALYEAPFGVVSHGLGDDPIFNYGNRTALRLFEMNWANFVALPSRRSAEAASWTERQKLLDRVSEFGFVDGYQGVRISATGKRFRIEQTTIWNVLDEKNVYRGQAALIFRWSAL